MHRYGRAAVLVHTTATARHAIRSRVNIAATLAGQDDDINTMDAIHNLGNLYTEQGKLDKAKEIYVLALKGYEKLFCYNHQCCHHLGCTLSTLRDHGGTKEIDPGTDAFIPASFAKCQPQCSSCTRKRKLHTVRLT
jgi:tetratricopeptide (TPR) repeat protein